MSLRAFRPDTLAILAILTLSLALAGCAVQRHLDSDPWTRAQSDQPGPSPAVPAALVTRAQWLLWKLGYDPGLFNGLQGRRTVAAVRAYQNANHLIVDGRVSARLVAHLEGAHETMMVADVQERLEALGFDPGGVDGKLGPSTRTAIEAYQQSVGLTADGDLSPRLLHILAVEAVFTQGGGALQQTEIPASAAMPPGADGPGDAALATRASSGRLKLSDLVEAGQGDVVATLPDADQDERVPTLTEAEHSERAADSPETNQDEPIAALPAAYRDEQIAALPAAYQDEQVAALPAAETENASGADLAAEPPFAFKWLPDENTPLGSEPPGPDLTEPLAPGDRVRLIIFGEDKQERELEVSTDGRLYLSDGVAVRAAGLSLPELEEEIMIKLVETYFLGLSVTVSRPEPLDGAATPDQPVP